MGETTTATKLRADTALLDRSMKQKKEAFGVQVYAQVAEESAAGGSSGGWRAALTTSAVDKEVAATVDDFKQAVAVPTHKKEAKQREIEQLGL